MFDIEDHAERITKYCNGELKIRVSCQEDVFLVLLAYFYTIVV